MSLLIIYAFIVSLCFAKWFIDGLVEYVISPVIDKFDNFVETGEQQ
jgi:hypothetical protein